MTPPTRTSTSCSARCSSNPATSRLVTGSAWRAPSGAVMGALVLSGDVFCRRAVTEELGALVSDAARDLLGARPLEGRRARSGALSRRRR